MEGFLEEVRLHKSQLVRMCLLRDLGRAFQAGEHHVHSHGAMRKRDSVWEFQIISDDLVGGFQLRGRQGLVYPAKGPEGNGEPQEDLTEQRRDQVRIF